MSVAESLQQLADDIAAACKEKLNAEIAVTRHNRTAWDDDGSGLYAMDVGVIYQYNISRLEQRYHFGWRWLPYTKWHALVSFGGDEFFRDGEILDLWCHVHDARLAEAVRPFVEAWVSRNAYGVLARYHKLTWKVFS